MVDNSRREDHKPDDRLDLEPPLLSMSTQGCRVEELEHTAEIGLRVFAASRAEAYACMATAMFVLTGASADPAAEQTARTITVHAADAGTLLVDWLNELLFLYETTGEVCATAQISDWHPTELKATVTSARGSETPALHIKAVTYHDLAVEKQNGAWMVQVYFDI
jgi:SHS2 domain-containing protein